MSRIHFKETFGSRRSGFLAHLGISYFWDVVHDSISKLNTHSLVSISGSKNDQTLGLADSSSVTRTYCSCSGPAFGYHNSYDPEKCL